MLSNIRHRTATALKRLVYGSRGEPYRIHGHLLRFLPGTRPVRLGYINSTNDNVRYDALQVQILSNNLSVGDCAIDIGAHAGQYAILMAARCGGTGRVIAFEPDPFAREILLKNLALNPGVKRPDVESYAVSDAAGDSFLFSRAGNAQSSLAQSGVEFSDDQHSLKIPVRLVALDDYIDGRNIPTPRWVKIDAEGAEVRILKGAKKLLATDSGIICELHPYAWAEFGNTFEELKELVASAGRRVRYLDEDVEAGHAKYGTVFLERLT